MPLLRTDTGCRWRKTLVSMTTTRLRRSRGAGWRNMLFQTCELRMKSPTDIRPSLTLRAPLELDVRLGVDPLPELFLEFLALVHDELAGLKADGPALQRPRGGALEVDARDVEAAAVAGAFKLLLLLQPVGRAAEVGAGGAEG